MAVLAASLMRGRTAVLLFSMVLPYIRPFEIPSYVKALAADHRISVEFASKLNPGDLVLSAQPEMFLNHDRSVMNVVFASERKEKLEEEIRHRKIWYHSGVRANVVESQDWLADRWVKSNFELHLIESQDVSGLRIAFYQVLLKLVDRKAGLGNPFECETHRCKRGRTRTEFDVLIAPAVRVGHRWEEVFCKLCFV